MSKMDELRALREARYAQRGTPVARPATKPAAKSTTGPTASTPPRAAAASPATSVADDGAISGPALCGHRNISGRTCTREKGHAAKTHRYS